MAAPVLLRVSVPRWERVARYAVCLAGIALAIYGFHLEREKGRDLHYRALCDLSERVRCSAAIASRYDSKCGSSASPHDVLHSICNRILVPGLHSVLCAEGILRCLCHHLLAELHSLYHQLQTTGLLERSLETATATQAGLAPLRTLDRQSEDPDFHFNFISQ
ncbi:vitamin K epoxide reductase complex subunit 1-like protein 1 isoform X2 [Varanus komodoensis]|nr:vitamin K epoxide reductase complex subunit 1-like protein 1 isoform X2 [Varanus komodoensis]